MSVTVETDRTTRKARFRAALALARMTAKQWASDNGVTETHLYAVLKGTRDSATLTSKVDAFIAQHLKNEKPATSRSSVVVAGGR